ncbi:MAG: BrnT family toxin [Magnetococcales bacterium]|nr:BrnT family toxin [Magnetococcales bacterium]
MKITYDPMKRDKTLIERGLDFDDTPRIFSGSSVTLSDDRKDYGEKRFITFGLLLGRMVAVVWTLRGDARRIISLRFANEREISRYQHRLG